MASCEECGSRMDKDWEFCPKCGNNLRQRSGDIFSEIFERFGQEFGEMNKMFEKQMEAVDISPMFRKPKTGHGGGFSISIMTSRNNPPKVSVKTFGDVDERKLKQQIYGQIGDEEGLEMESAHQLKNKKPKVYDVTEEPKTKVQKTGNKVTVDMELPGVKSSGDIEVRELESSLEVKATAGKKAFFKIITKPEKYKVATQKFDNGVLHLEFS